MALTAFTGTVSASTLQSNFDDKTSTLNTNAARVGGDWWQHVHKIGLTTTAIYTEFTPPTDVELRVLRVQVQDTGAGRTVTATLTQADGDADFLLGQTVAVSIASANGLRFANTDFRTVTTFPRIRLLRGVPYRLSIVSTGATTWAQAAIQLRGLWRKT